MRRRASIATILTLFVGVALIMMWYVSSGVLPEEQGTMRPSFSEYPVMSVYDKEPTEVNFASYPPAKTFVTRITEGAAEGPNFAGHYTVITWGCGTACQSSAIVDARTGNIVAYGVLSTRGLAYHLDSELLIVNPKEEISEEDIRAMREYPGEHFPLGTVPTTEDFYVMEGESLTFIGKYGVISGEQQSCAQVMSPARNPITQEVVEFPTPCHIPFGWEGLETAEGGDI